MNMKKLIEIMNHLSGETILEDKKIYEYTKQHSININTFSNMFEVYAKDNSEIKTWDDLKNFRRNMKKLFKSGKLTTDEKEILSTNIKNIGKKYIKEDELPAGRNKKLLKTKKGIEKLSFKK